MDLSRREWYVLGVSAVLFLITGLILAETIMPEPSPRRENGTWVIEQQADSDYHRYHPRAEQVTFIGNPGPYNISTEQHMRVNCFDAVTRFLFNHTQEQLANRSYSKRFTIRTVHDDIEIDPYDRNRTAAFRKVAPDSVRCTIHFQGHTYRQHINVTVRHVTYGEPVERPAIDCSETRLNITGATYNTENGTGSAAITNTGSWPLNVTLAAFFNNKTDDEPSHAVEMDGTLPVNATRTVTVPADRRPIRLTAASPDCPAARASTTNITDR